MGNARLKWWVRWSLIAAFGGTLLLALSLWAVPLDVVLVWVHDRPGLKEFQRVDAAGEAEFLIWLLRFAAIPACLASCLLLIRLGSTTTFVSNAFGGWLSATGACAADVPTSRWRTYGLRIFFVAWCALALWHAGLAVQERMHQWRFFRFWSGDYVLPNISDANASVIRYLQSTTPSNARIFVASDQKLFFISYYVLPRRIYHKIHPESEFVLPQADLQNRLEAYRLADISPETIERIAPDYILEYFEHPDSVDRTRLREDTAWLLVFRQVFRGQEQPTFLVSLRPVRKGAP